MNITEKILTLLVAAFFYLQPVFAQTNLPEQGICAHRGAMDTHPENTIAAFKEAIRLQAQMIELDVRMTKDKQLVILHDETVDRTTNGTGKIEELSFKQVRQLDAGGWKSPDFEGEKIPTFAEVLAVMPNTIWLNVHLKGDRKLGTKVAEVLIKENKQHQAFLACGTEAAKGAHAVSPDILICNMERQTEIEDYIDQTIDKNNEFIQLKKVEVNPEIENYTKRLKANNVKVNYCCTDSPEEVIKLFDYGVDFVLVNDLGEIMKAVEPFNFSQLNME